MRITPVLCLVSAFVITASAANRNARPEKQQQVSVQQLDQALTDAARRADESRADQDLTAMLSSMKLTQRASTQRLEQWRTAMPGDASRRALTALVDSSAFLNLPDEDLPKLPPPDKDAQQRMVAATSAYVTQVLLKLPNLFASESVMTFQEIEGMKNQSGAVAYQPFHYAGIVHTNVRYLDDKELVESANGELAETDQLSSHLLFSGEFGPILDTVFRDTQGKFSWSHWEAGPSSTLAVLRYSVGRNKSHCQVKILIPGAKLPWHAKPGYHGEIAIDPTSGTIYRMTLMAELSPEDPVGKANTAIEYGPVEIAGNKLICPVRSVRQVTILDTDGNGPMTVGETNQGFGNTGSVSRSSSMNYSAKGDVASQTLLNDTVYEQYHLLKSDVRVLPADEKTQ